MTYHLQGDFCYKDRKKKINFKESFNIPLNNCAIADAFDAEFIYLQISDFGKFIEKKVEFVAKGRLTLTQQFHFTLRKLLDIEVIYDFKDPYKKI